MDEGTDDDSEVHAECVEVNAEKKNTCVLRANRGRIISLRGRITLNGDKC